MHAAQLGIPVLFLVWVAANGEFADDSPAGTLWLAYFIFCWIVAALFLPKWLWYRFTRRVPAALVSSDSQMIDVTQAGTRKLVHGWKAGLLTRVPLNQVFRLEVSHKTLRLERLPRELTGLRIAHVSDLHFSGRITRAFFDRAVELVNELRPDLVAISGDICDVPACMEWIPATLGQLRSRSGTFAIFGNHDLLVNTAVLANRLKSSGVMYLGGQFQEIEVAGARVLLAGNEWPWFDAIPDLQGLKSTAAPDGARALRILLSHSPDQFAWSCRHEFDLVLAGHTHGGQIRLPLIGPMACPSRYGVRFASGLFQQCNTVMHVSRGLSGLTPLRLNCPPEITLLELR
jgi:predicted MPP superfamily phosphohydrolase